MTGRRALDTLTAAEQAAVLDDLLAAHHGLAGEAERLATEHLDQPDRAAVAGEVEDALTALTVEDVWERGVPSRASCTRARRRGWRGRRRCSRSSMT